MNKLISIAFLVPLNVSLITWLPPPIEKGAIIKSEITNMVVAKDQLNSTPTIVLMKDTTMNDVERWAHNYLATVDGGNLNEITSYFAEDIRLRMGNQDPVQGKANARKSFAQVSGEYTTNHQIKGVWTGTWEEGNRSGNVVSIEVAVTYTLKDGQAITVPNNTTLKLDGDLISDYQIFIDLTPVQEAQKL